MPQKYKLDDDDFDIDELDVEYDEVQYETYDGDIPKTGTVLRGYVQKAWMTWTEPKEKGQKPRPMLKVILKAEGNTGRQEEYNGLPVWDNITFTPNAAFHYGPFLKSLGITLRDVKAKMVLGDDDESNGAPIIKIAAVEIGEDARIQFVIKRTKWDGEWQAKASGFLPDPGDDEDSDDEDEDEPTPTRGRAASARSKPAARASSKAARGRSRPADDDPDDDDPEDEPDDDEEADDEADGPESDDDDTDDDDEPDEPPARSNRSRAGSGRSGGRTAGRAASSGRGRGSKARGKEEDPF